GKMRHGSWLQDGEDWYYLNANGKMRHSAWLQDGEDWYYLNANGKMRHSSWLQDGEDWYYFRESGKMCKGGWLQVGEAWYYLSEGGKMRHETWISYEGAWYYLKSNGQPQTGWFEYNGSKYHFRDSGKADTGWAEIDGSWYYFSEDGKLQTGWIEVDGFRYFLQEDGQMLTGWRQEGDDWYYLKENGRMQTGWTEIEDDWYYFYPETGKMAVDTEIGVYVVDKKGRMLDPDMVSMMRKAQSYSSTRKYFIMVNTYTHKVGIFQGKKGSWTMIHYWDCTTGAPRTPTIKGNFRVGSRGTYFDHDKTIRLYWWTQIKGNYLFHSTLYNKSGKPVDSRLGMSLSLGCVRLAIENAKWIYDNVPTGTAIHID
ncbi:MAG: L,D-transpeptidase family protein, partial [Lachnospiraceae bacterium]|nr:L,D-transpeptidase family protein [Lachnospiraceae bacterium]